MSRPRTTLGRYRRGRVVSKYPAQMLVRVSAEQIARWRQAASDAAVGLSEWVRARLDEAQTEKSPPPT